MMRLLAASAFLLAVLAFAPGMGLLDPTATTVKNARDYEHLDFRTGTDTTLVTYEIVNTGHDVLLLDNVRASCGLRVKRWPRGPIAPGATAAIQLAVRPSTRRKAIRELVVLRGNIPGAIVAFRLAGRTV